MFGHESPAGNNNQALVVRFTADGALDTTFGARGRFVLTQSRLGAAPDRTFGLGGLAAIFGPRSSFAFGYPHLATLSCEDRLLVGGNVGTTPVVSVLDGRGEVLTEVGTLGSVALAAESLPTTVHAVLSREGTSDAVAVVSRGVGSLSLHRLEQ